MSNLLYDKEIKCLLCDEKFIVQMIRNSKLAVSKRAVSYTHLDVYKRQGKGLKDMQLLYEGKEIDLYPGIVMPKVTYSDYLRLFLLLQSKKSHLDHMRQLMQVDLRMADMQFNLKNQSAAFTLEAEVSIDLLFIKGLDKLYPERFSKGRFLITKRATVGY